MKPLIVASALALATSLTFSQANTQDHSAHHPPGAAAPAEAVPPGTPGTPGAQAVAPDAYARQMQMMRDMHKRMQEARTPAERQALMDEHMKLMQSGMQMMSRMGQGGMGMGGMGGMGAAPAPGTPADQKGPAAMGGMGAGGMMGMHGGMERRMAMMEQMMQMMVDREAAMPRR